MTGHIPLSDLAQTTEGILDDWDVLYALGHELERHRIAHAVYNALVRATNEELMDHRDEVLDLIMGFHLEHPLEFILHEALLRSWESAPAGPVQQSAASRAREARASMAA